MIVIDYRDKRPLYEQVAEKLSQLIICGVLESNSKLPSVRSLAMELSINPNTIQRAYNQLEQDGYIYTVVGRGNYVTDALEWKTGYQRGVLQELRDSLKKTRGAGISQEEVLGLVREIYSADTASSPPEADSSIGKGQGADPAAGKGQGADPAAGKGQGADPAAGKEQDADPAAARGD